MQDLRHNRGHAISYFTRNTIHYKTPRHFLLDKIICEHMYYELVITIAYNSMYFKPLPFIRFNTVYTVSKSSLPVHHYFVYSFCITSRTLNFMHAYLFFDLVCCQNCFKNIPCQVFIGLC